MSFITFYTPTYKRPTYLSICRRSVQLQACRDFQHMVIVDDAGIGVDGMFWDIRHHTDDIRGEYVFILADDDRLIGDLAVVKAFARANDNPPVIILKNNKWGQTFPLVWEAEPELTKIDTGNFIIRADVFRETVTLFGQRYEGDFDYIHALWERGYAFTWLDHVFSEMQVGGRGLTEVELMGTGEKIRVRCIRGFVSDFSVSVGQEVDMPAGADWVRAGLCVPVAADPPIVIASIPDPSQDSVSTETVETTTLPVTKVERAVGKGGKR